jgi:anti-anti-sigma factor
LRIEAKDGLRAFRLVGAMDGSNASNLGTALRSKTVEHGDIVLDMSRLSFLDGAGTLALADVAKRLQGRGNLVLVTPSHHLERHLDLIRGARRLGNLKVLPAERGSSIPEASHTKVPASPRVRRAWDLLPYGRPPEVTLRADPGGVAMAQSLLPYSARPHARQALSTAAPARGGHRVARSFRGLSLVMRVLLTLGGATLLVLGGLLTWTEGLAGVKPGARAFYQSVFVWRSDFVATVGFVMILLGLLAVAGLALRSGWLTRISGVLSIIGFMLLAVQLYRAPVQLLGEAGPWLCLAGGTAALIGGFFGTRRSVRASPVAPGASAVRA